MKKWILAWGAAVSLAFQGCGDGGATGGSPSVSGAASGATGAAGHASSGGVSGQAGTGGQGLAGSAAGAGAYAGKGGAAGAASGGKGGPGGAVSSCSPSPDVAFDPLPSFLPQVVPPTVVVTSAADDGAGSLRAALAGAPSGAAIGFAPSLAKATISLSSTLVLTRSVTIDGSQAPGISVSGQKAVGLFAFNGDSPTKLVFSSLRLVDGHTDGPGGAIDVNGGSVDLEIAGCAFDGNAASVGGAVRAGYAKGTTVAIHDSVFSNNDGSLAGTDNGFSGGAVSTIGTNLTVRRCRFEKNMGPAAGALYELHSDPVVEDSVFVDNAVTGDNGSGAFFTDGGGPGDYNAPGDVPGQITVRRSRFVGNLGKGTNGGAALLYAYPQDTVTLEDVVFQGNHAQPGKGGAIFVHADKEVHILRSAFVDNVAEAQGGAIWADGAAAFTLENVLFSGNQVMVDRGGAATFNIAETGSITLAHATFVGNTAGQGVEAFWLPGMRNVTVRNSIVANASIAHAWEGQINFDVTDGGGNVEWPDPGGGRRSLAVALLADPMLAALVMDDTTPVQPIPASSPAVGRAVSPAASVDQRGAKRDATPDSGAYEAGASCSP